ncbi:hypothetical protein FHP25_08735 [Vineibacter terrae]|uniref:Uncharacterized protein n=1 Tax=Vineibacter terrae TaxID=2586908 RepID=A0A5C8PRZ7_9HYPH|nr:hypothetical protein [Vineibacter terrae]TXL78264.1 hypothetical protein FHP25_08735 [Vineibacter terrae]
MYYGIALRMVAPSVHFTVRLSHEVHARACDSDRGYIRYLQRHISQILQRNLGTVPPFYFVVEADGPNDIEPHLHGGIGIASLSLRQQAKIRKLLRVAAGEFPDPKARRYQARLGQFTDLIGWSGYITKAFDPTQGEIDGRLVGVTARVASLARELYEEDRACLLALYAELASSET